MNQQIKKAYGYNENKINSLTKINIKNYGKSVYYNYKNINFLLKLKLNSKKLVVVFHGALTDKGVHRVVFRGFDFNFKETDIICISDGLISIYENFKIGWFLSTQKHNFKKIYLEIFKFFIYNKNKNYKKVMFTGTSGGGYPSLYFASIFNKIALIGNSQLYLEDYSLFKRWRVKRKDGICGLLDLTDKDNDKLIYQNKNIEHHLKKHKPQKIILYNNILDLTYKVHTKPFINFINKNNLKNILELNLFKGGIPKKNKTQHHISFPNDIKHSTIINKYLQ